MRDFTVLVLPCLVVVFLLLEVQATGSSTACKSGFKQYGTNGNCYHFLNIHKDFAESERRCQQLGAHLAKVTDDRLLQWAVTNLVRKAGSNRDFWVGLKDGKKHKGVFKWLDGSEYSRQGGLWNPGTPNGARDGKECARFRWVNNKFVLDDISCTRDYAALCEIKKDAPSASCGSQAYKQLYDQSQNKKSQCSIVAYTFVMRDMDADSCAAIACKKDATGFQIRGRNCVAFKCKDEDNFELARSFYGQNIFKLEEGGGSSASCGLTSFQQKKSQADGYKSTCKFLKISPMMPNPSAAKCADIACSVGGANGFQFRGPMCTALKCDDPSDLELQKSAFAQNVYVIGSGGGEKDDKFETLKEKREREKKERNAEREKQREERQRKKREEFEKKKEDREKRRQEKEAWRDRIREARKNRRKKPSSDTCVASPDVITCMAWGDPHYRTYDCGKVNYQGNCTYVLTEPCEAAPEDTDFHVLVTNEKSSRNEQVSTTRDVIIRLNSLEIVLFRGGTVEVDGVEVELPTSPRPDVTITRVDRDLVEVKTTFGLVVTFDCQSRVTVTLPSNEYAGNMCGLCGDGDGDASNDMWMRTQTFTGSPAEFGDSWVVQEYPCHKATTDESPDPDDEELEDAGGPDKCGMMDDADGPFKDCQVHTDDALEGCIMDVVEMGDDEEEARRMLCEALKDYAEQCLGENVIVHWRRPDFCPHPCGPNSHYNPGMSRCPNTCVDPDAAETYSEDGLIEGCECSAGHVLSNGECVAISECGCYHQEQYRQKDSSWLNDDCTKYYTCEGGDSVNEEPYTCDGECVVHDGRRQCLPASSPCYCEVIGDPVATTCSGQLTPLDKSAIGEGTQEIVVQNFVGFGTVTATISYDSQHHTLTTSHITLRLANDESWQILPDGSLNTPGQTEIPGATISSSSEVNFQGTIVTFNNGVSVRFGTYHDNFVILSVTIPQVYLADKGGDGLCKHNDILHYSLP